MLRILIKRAIDAPILRILRCHLSSGGVAVKHQDLHERDNDQQKSYADALLKSEKLRQVRRRIMERQPTRAPFAKNLFVGVFDNEMLTYPEALSKSDVDCVEADLQPVQHFFDTLGDDATSRQLTEGAAALRLHGLCAEELAGGRELCVTEMCRFSEAIATRTGDMRLLHSEVCGVQALLKFGTKQQIAKYLPDLVSGRLTMALCLLEEASSDPFNLNTLAAMDANRKVWVLNGKKTQVLNCMSADLFVVLAKTREVVEGLSTSHTSVFLVERSAGGVVSKKYETLGLKESEIGEVTFTNTLVSTDNLLGQSNKGVEVVAKLMSEINLMNTSACVTLSKKAVNKFIDYCKQSHSQSNNIADMELVHVKLAHYTTHLYALESMLYLTAGLLDKYIDQDCVLEASICKTFAIDTSNSLTASIINFIGEQAYLPDHWATALHRDAIFYALHNGTSDNNKILIGLQGIQHAGVVLQAYVTKIRNPLHYTTEVFKRMWADRRQNSDNPSLDLNLHFYLHPSAMQAAEMLEYSVLRLKFITEQMLIRHGTDVVQRHSDLVQLGECAVDCYAMVAALGRASRAYCIGLSNADQEMILATVFCYNARRRVKSRVQHICDGRFITNEAAFGKIAERVFHTSKYYPEHPLTRNF